MGKVPAANPQSVPRKRMLDTAQETVQQLLRFASVLGDGIGEDVVSPLTPADMGQKLEDYNKFLHKLDRISDGLRKVRIPLDAVRHLDESNLALAPWCQNLARRLRTTNE